MLHIFTCTHTHTHTHTRARARARARDVPFLIINLKILFLILEKNISDKRCMV